MLTPEEHAAFLNSVDNVRETAERYLRIRASQQSAVAFVANLQRGISHVTRNAIEQGVPIACQAGCNYCCCARVEVMAPEVFHIARELTGRPPDELNHHVQRLKTHVALPREATTWDRRNECPFLTNGLCSIYDVRPSACRKAHSLDVRKCAANAPEIPQDLGLVVAAEALTTGTSDAYRKAGLDAARYELGRAVLIALSDPLTESRWYKGGAVFAPESN